MPNLSRDAFVRLARETAPSPGRDTIIPVAVRLLADHLTPTVAYRRLVAADDRHAPSFLLESVEAGERQGRFSILGAQPKNEIIARGPSDHDPFDTLRAHTRSARLVRTPGLPQCFLGGLAGFAAYDSVRYAHPDKLPFDKAPPDDRRLPDLCFGVYDTVVVFDHAERVVVVVGLSRLTPGIDPGAAYDQCLGRVRGVIATLNRHAEPLASGELPPDAPPPVLASNMTREAHRAMLSRAKEYIRAGDAFQIVLGQRFEATSAIDPFDAYRALRCVNPSPYMVYMQAGGCVLVGSSPEILCRVRGDGDIERPRYTVTNRPLAGTRRRGRGPEEDARLARELLADAKERAEHVMLVDLGRNDVGVVARPGTVALPAVMDIERYSHVMHISSTVTGELREGLDGWDALRAALPVGTISGAPKLRAMQIIDELEPCRRGPYGGGMGYVGYDGQMDMALTLRTMVVTPAQDGQWTYHLQASGGIVADSDFDDEYQETVNKAAALARALAVARGAFGRDGPG